MKVLVIAPRVPARDRKGDQVLSFFRTTYLARRHEVHVLCYGRGPQDEAAAQALRDEGVSVEMLPMRRMRSLISLASAVWTDEPFQCALFRSLHFQVALDHAQRSFQPDRILAVTIRILSNLKQLPATLCVDMVDSMALNFGRRHAGAEGLKRWALGVELQRVRRFEQRVAHEARNCFVVSGIDQKEIGIGTVQALPLGIDLNHFSPATSQSNEPVLAFTGNMNYQPNAEAVIWFTRHCWPQVKSAVPAARLVIAGSNPGEAVQQLGRDPSITVTGRVPSMADVIRRSSVAIAPMQSGSGMQFKILEAMACGVPVVTTTLGLGDITARPAQDLLVADGATDFTSAVVSLLQSPDHRAAVSSMGLAHVRRHHGWDVLNQRFCTACGILPS